MSDRLCFTLLVRLAGGRASEEGGKKKKKKTAIERTSTCDNYADAAHRSEEKRVKGVLWP